MSPRGVYFVKIEVDENVKQESAEPGAGCPYLFEIRDKRKYNLRKRKRRFIIKGLA
ncbi:MAG: hypothetical protein V3W51_00145 [Candidatus Brocadiales bacterium]